MNIGKQLKELRLKRGITQEALAARLDVHQPSLSRLESDSYLPSLRYVTRVAKALNATVEITVKERV